ncbi:Retrovirus-related Pol polyprotein from transposon 412 [Frankliniella fusca]|uniref:RNA-directed DNA polymerase n=1 Tax=Frankliniella fusca TaxID=407009 RepID=A0AAE1LMU9_9NEOP|nr:Retrovirus-related Pol polyprotein from transposon 412 [Frankliniella fusca]
MLNNVSMNPVAYPLWELEGYQLYKKIFTGISPEATWVRVVPKEKRKEVYVECHDAPLSGHFGFYKTFNRIRMLYYWPCMRKEILEYVSGCRVCIEFKAKNTAPEGLMGARRVVTAPMQIISCDLMGPLPRSSSGYSYLVVTNCWFTKYVWARPLRDATAKAVACHLEEDVFWKFGAPKTLACDNGQQYKSKEVTSMCEKYGVKMLFNFAYHPQSNPTERVNRVLKTMLASYVDGNQKSWDRKLPQLVAAINSARSEVTKFTSHFLMFGRQLNFHAQADDKESPVEDGEDLEFAREAHVVKLKELDELRGEVEDRLKTAYEKNAKRYNLRRRDVEYEVVWFIVGILLKVIKREISLLS